MYLFTHFFTQSSTLVKNTGSGVQLPAVKSQPQHLLLYNWPGKCYSKLPGLRFLPSKVRLFPTPPYETVGRSERRKACKDSA